MRNDLEQPNGGASGTWEFLEADADERAAFVDLETTRGHVVDFALPPNRFRQVHRVEIGDRVWYLKEFVHTQWKNRCRSALTRPRCILDADRERLVARALRDRGFQVGRPVAVGRVGGSSYYLVAELSGTSLRDLLEQGACDRELAWAAARHAGAILKSGVQLPDLSADHIFVCRGGGFAVIDLHNGTLAPRTSRRTATRIFRRFRRSVRGCGVDRGLALGFASRLLKTAGFGARERRRVIERTPPMDTHGRYEVPGRSARYRHRNSRRTSRELSLLRRVWPGRPGDLVLDAPSGAGRIGPTIRDPFGARRLGIDRAMAMLRESRDAGDPDTLVQGDSASLPIVDRGLDGVLLFRFLHHLDPDSAKKVLAEAARVSRRFVVVSFFHPISVHGVMRRAKQWAGRRARTRFAVTRGQLESWLGESGFELTDVAADQPYLRDFWVASFLRVNSQRQEPS